ncbi:DHA2 family methylenomycin A resistance protein-like MFS transporter [Streptomyces africanus]|uniref:DHA2 family methylenomycin A resistance protein-like MFS transporter n=1 Tax=Streptomyces africanus TaxID=231024 RepID=A0ABU0QP43_9ACTN|nr:MFS transporter [Streptomyces africanus]MDQ0749164.1 DHA2 family methylenomycin A resistance protein-like MFS transporter [Streptomyces africanus]
MPTTRAPSSSPARTTASPPAEGPAVPRRSGVALVASLLGFTVITVDVSAVNIALPAIRDSLSGGMAGLQWVVDAYTLMFAALMLSAGALADRIGARRAYAWGVALFTLASLGCALAPGIGVLVGARVAQGAAAAIVMPASLALIRQAYDDSRARARAIALWTVGGSVAMAAGPVLGGLLTDSAGWRAVFLLNLPVGAVILGLLVRVPRSPRRPAALDGGGQLTAVLALAGLAFAVIEGGRLGWTSGPVAAAAALALASGYAFYVVEARHRRPMVPLGMLRDRRVAVPLAVGFAVNAAFYGGIFLLGLYYQQLRGMSAIAAGLMFVPMSAVVTATNLVSPRLAERIGRRPVIVAGQLIFTGAMLAMLPLAAHTPVWLVLVLLLPLSVGGALAVPAVTALLMDAVPQERAGTASGLLNSLRQTGGALSVALFGSLLAGPGGDFSLPGMRIGLLAVAALLFATAVLSRLLLPRS